MWAGKAAQVIAPFRPEWIRQIRDRCEREGVAFFFKQWGGKTAKSGGNTLDGRTWLEYPPNHLASEQRARRRRTNVVNEHSTVGPWAKEKLTCLAKYLHAVFLDPFGMQVPWSTIELLAKTKAIEAFINFPVGMAIQRLLRRDAAFSPEQRARMDLYMGSSDWFDVVYQKTTGLFGETIDKAPDSNIALTRWYRKRLKELFGFASSARLVRSSSNHPLYYLIHAGPNATGAKIAEHILQQGEVI